MSRRNFQKKKSGLARIKNFSRIAKKYLVYFVVIDILIAVAFGYYYPKLAEDMKPYVYIPIFIMLIPMMTAADVTGIGKAFKNPKIVISVVILNFIITPPLGYLFAQIFYAGQPDLLKVGFILNMVTPCSDMVIAWTAFAAGSIEIATMVVSLSLLLSIITIPAWMWILTRNWVNVPVDLIFKDLLIIVVIPLIIGYLLHWWIVNKWGEEKFVEIKPTFPAISSIGMYMIVFLAMAIVAQKIVKNPYYIVLVAVSMAAYYFTLFAISILWSKGAKIRYEEAIALTYSVTAKNLSITIALATVTWGGLAVIAPAFDPVVQVPVMIVILSVSEHIKKYFHPELKEPTALPEEVV